MNRIILIGRTTKDIEVRYTTQQMAVAKFRLAVNRRKKADGKEPDTDFINCTAFGKIAEIMEKYVKKGHRVGVAGRIQTGSYDKDGVRYYTTDVIVDELEFLESKRQESPQEQEFSQEQVSIEDVEFEYIDEELPF